MICMIRMHISTYYRLCTCPHWIVCSHAIWTCILLRAPIYIYIYIYIHVYTHTHLYNTYMHRYRYCMYGAIQLDNIVPSTSNCMHRSHAQYPIISHFMLCCESHHVVPHGWHIASHHITQVSGEVPRSRRDAGCQPVHRSLPATLPGATTNKNANCD